MAIPGIFLASTTLSDAHEAHLVMGRECGVQIHIDEQKVRLGSADASEALAIASKVKEELDKFCRVFNTHVHPAPHGSPTVSQIGPIADIASKKVVAE